MAKLSKASLGQRSRPPRRDMYEVPTTVESEESGKYAQSTHQLYANLLTQKTIIHLPSSSSEKRIRALLLRPQFRRSMLLQIAQRL